jgi:uncharacterized protein
MPTRDTAPNGAPCWADLMTSDTERSCEFYRQLFGWTFEDAGEEFGHYINFFKDGVQVAGGMGRTPEMGDMPDVWSVYLASDDAEKTTETAVAEGGEILVPAMAVADLGTMAVVSDAGQAAIGIWQPGVHKGFGVLGEPGTPSWFELHTRDYDASLAFYRAVFHWDTDTVGDTPDFRYTTLGKGDAALAGIMDASGFLPEGVPAHWSVYWETADVDASVAKAVELGGTLVLGVDDTPYGRLATLMDPTGAMFKLRQRPSA